MGLNILEFFKQGGRSLKKNHKIAFISAFFAGLCVHIYKFTNMLPNHDAIELFYSSQNVTGSGRWFLSTACGFSSYFDLPWVIGLISILLVAVTAVLIVEMFKITNPVLIVLSSALLVTFPALTETFFFEYTADGYMLAMALAALAALLTRFENQWKYSYPVAAVCICLVCGIYQSYVSFSLMLTACSCALLLIEGSVKVRQCLYWLAKQAVMYAVALLFYWVIWKFALKIQNISANEYQGIDNMHLSFVTIVNAIPKSLKTCLWFFLERGNVLNGKWTPYSLLNVVFLAFFAGTLITVVVKRKIWKDVPRLFLLLMMVAATPLIACLWHFVTPEVHYRPMMLYSLCVLYIFGAVLAEEFLRLRWKNIAAMILALVVYNNALSANIAYAFMNRAYEKTYAMGIEMASRIHMLGMNKVAVVGNRYYETRFDYYPENGSDQIFLLSALLNKDFLYDRSHVGRWLNDFMGYSFERVSREDCEELEKRPEIQKMGCWPAIDSIQIVDDIAVIKLADMTS